MLPFLPNQTQSFPTGMPIYPDVCQRAASVLNNDACSPQSFWVGPEAHTFPSFQALLEEAFFFLFFLTSVCYTNATFNECYDVEKFKKLCCVTYMVLGNIGGSVGNYPNYNDKCINVGLENPWKEKR